MNFDERVLYIALSGLLCFAIGYRLFVRIRQQTPGFSWGREILLFALLIPKGMQFVLSIIIYLTYTPLRDYQMYLIPAFGGYSFLDVYHWLRSSIGTVDFILILYFLNGELVAEMRNAWCQLYGARLKGQAKLQALWKRVWTFRRS